MKKEDSAVSGMQCQQVLDPWQDIDCPCEKCVHELFEEQVERTPSATAVEYENLSLTYEELNCQANRLAHYLCKLEVGPDVKVAICAERSLEMVVGLLAVLKSGATYVPLDSMYPAERLRLILEDCRPVVLLVQCSLRQMFAQASETPTVVDLGKPDLWSDEPATNLERSRTGLTSRHLAYVIYTSGSTGHPKGVMVEHAGLSNYLKWAVSAYHPKSAIVSSSFSFDATVTSLHLALLRGGTVTLLPEGQEIEGLCRELQAGRTCGLVKATPSHLHAVAHKMLSLGARSAVDVLVIGGEALSSATVQLWRQVQAGVRIVNEYGPTETVVGCVVYELPQDIQSGVMVPIGSPIANTQIYILGSQGEPVPAGIIGELYIGGVGVARGYLKQPALTAERFVPNPFSKAAGERLYRTGDLGRWCANGTIEFLGRNDFQVKIRGYRVELEEIEAQLKGHPGIRDAVVVAQEDGTGENRLVCYYVMERNYRGDGNLFRGALKNEQLSGWATTYNALYSSWNSQEGPTFYSAGWNSSYTRQAIAPEELQEWVERTVERISALQPKRVWEIGCGAGLLLFRIAPGCMFYKGTDVSVAAIRSLQQQLQHVDAHMPQVVLECRAAHEFGGAQQQEALDLILLNSVVQYFPDIEYLMTVLTGAVESLRPGGAIFIGDVRSYPLLEAFHISVQLFQTPDSLSCNTFWNRVQKNVLRENELVIDPKFFTALRQRLPQISKVEVHLKRGRAYNELTRFRYDVILHVGEADAELKCEWLDWNRESLNPNALREKLSRTQPEALGIKGIPNSRVQLEIGAARILSGSQCPATVAALRAELNKEQPSLVDLEELWELADESGYAVEIRWSCNDLGTCDAVFRRREMNGSGMRRLGVVRFPGEAGFKGSLESCATQPIQQELSKMFVAELRRWLARKLPEYMVPAAYVQMMRMPLTSNGKLDRKAFPAPERDAFATRSYEAPQGKTERILAKIWAELLQVDRVGRQDNFFELGGHSLQGVTLMERIRQNGFEIDVRELFSSRSLAELAASISEEDRVFAVPENGIPAECSQITPEMLPLIELTTEEIERVVSQVPGGSCNVQDIYPLAPLQEGILFHHRISGEGDPYLRIFQMAFDTRQRLDNYLAALQAVIDRHDILRTAVLWEGLREPVQVIWRKSPMRVEEVKLNSAIDAAEQMYARFDTRRNRIDVREAPLLRVYIGYDEQKDRWLLVLLLHHLVGDHTTDDLIEEEIAVHLLGREQQLPSSLPFRNFIAQARLGMNREECESFFRQMLGDVEETTAPFGLINVQGTGKDVEENRIMLNRLLSRRLRERARRLEVSPASLFHLAWARLMAKVSGRDDVIFGTVLFGRMRSGMGADRAMGLFINTLPIRLKIGEESVEAGVLRTHRVLAELMRHEHATLALVQRCSKVNALRPLFASLLNYYYSRQGSEQQKSPAWQGIEVLRAEERTNYPCVLSVEDRQEEFWLTAQVQAGIGAGRVCQYMQTLLINFVETLETEPEMPVSRLQILPEWEREQLLHGWNHTQTKYPREKCLPELFEAQAARAPDAIAVEFDCLQLTYGELNRQSNQLAHYLRKLGVKPDVRVAICMERGLEMIVGLLAVLKAGGAYVPLDPEYPIERLQFMLEDSGPIVLLTEEQHKPIFTQVNPFLPVLDMNDAAPQWMNEVEANPGYAATGLNTEHLAYVVYTSGSTGRPKGIAVPHRGITRLALNTNYVQLGPDNVIAQASNASFDAMTFEVWGALLTGARLMGVRKKELLSAWSLDEKIKQHKIDVLFLTTTLFHEVAWAKVEAFAALHYLLFGGEQVESRAVTRVLMHGKPNHFLHVYGPTETTTFATWHEITLDCPTVPIGQPLSNTHVYVLDHEGEPAPAGVVGEIFIGGDGLARGYPGRPALTAERFLANPHGGAGQRMYRTGDLGRWQKDGALEFIGRVDDQVKIRGFRIEPGEIEAVLRDHPDIGQAVVLAREDRSGQKQLVGYVVAVTGHTVNESHLRKYMRNRLPEYMIPAIVAMNGLPLTANGKLDRKSLPDPEMHRTSADYESPLFPENAVQRVIRGVWQSVLNRECVGIFDNFFDIGGHSLLVGRVHAKLQNLLGCTINLLDLFEYPTIASLSMHMSMREPELELITKEESTRLIEGRVRLQKRSVTSQQSDG